MNLEGRKSNVRGYPLGFETAIDYRSLSYSSVVQTSNGLHLDSISVWCIQSLNALIYLLKIEVLRT